MSTEENKAIIHRFLDEVVNKHNLNTVDELFDPNFVLHMGGSETRRGPEIIKQTASLFATAFPDWQNTLDDLIADGDKVVTRWSERGTHLGAFQGIAPTGKQVTLTGTDIFRVADGRIVEQWV